MQINARRDHYGKNIRKGQNFTQFESKRIRYSKKKQINSEHYVNLTTRGMVHFWATCFF